MIGFVNEGYREIACSVLIFVLTGRCKYSDL